MKPSIDLITYYNPIFYRTISEKFYKIKLLYFLIFFDALVIHNSFLGGGRVSIRNKIIPMIRVSLKIKVVSYLSSVNCGSEFVLDIYIFPHEIRRTKLVELCSIQVLKIAQLLFEVRNVSNNSNVIGHSQEL